MKPKVVINWNRAHASTGVNKGFRLNGRALHQFRTPQILFGKSYGSCEVLLQPGTRVLTQISCSVGEPTDARPGDGIMTVSVWISPSATGEMGGGGSQRPALIARTIEKLFKEHRVVDLESLCIKYGEKVWVLRADIHFLDMNGCLSEAAALSVLGALLTFRRPEAFIDKETEQVTVLSIEESVPVKVSLRYLPVLTSFVITDLGQVLIEPDQEEEDIFPGKLLVGINDSKELCFLHLTYPFRNLVLSDLTKMAQEKCMERIEWIKQLAQADEERRQVPLYERRKTQLRSEGRSIKIPSSVLPQSTTASDLEVMKDLSLAEPNVIKT
jgi:exosome complex component RRP45